MKKLKQTYIVILMLVLSACAEEMPDHILPYSPVNFKVDVYGQDKELNSHLGFKCFEKARLHGEYVGYGGLLVVRGPFADLYAFDLSCPNEKERKATLVPNSSGEAKCQRCNSIYDIANELGFPKSGVSKTPLQRYRVVVASPRGVFHIRNLR